MNPAETHGRRIRIRLAAGTCYEPSVPESGQAWDPDFLLGDPLFGPFERIARPLRGSEFPDAAALTRICEVERERRAPEARPLVFVPTEKKPRRKKRGEVVLDRLYDGSIALRGEVPCYVESYHDLFNAIAFAAFPRSKRALHARQFEALRRWVGEGAERVPGQRTREQDALTIFDEGGVVLAMSESARDAWRGTSGESQYVPGAPGVIALLFGHALLEHLYKQHLAIRASALVCIVRPELEVTDLLDEVDRALAQRLADPVQFSEPGGDCIFEMKRDGTYSFRAPRMDEKARQADPAISV